MVMTMRPPANLDGQRFYSLTVIGLSSTRNSYGRLLYKCRCDCGNIVYATASNLKRGEVRRCVTCKRNLVTADISGHRFGRLVAISPTDDLPARGQGRKWLCQCDCGNTCSVGSRNLINGAAQSCGCLQVDRVKSLYVDGTAPCKLRESDHPRSTNTSGYTGVWYDKRRNKWVAEIIFRRKKYYLGRYGNINDAISARKEAEVQIYGNFLDWYNNLKTETTNETQRNTQNKTR